MSVQIRVQRLLCGTILVQSSLCGTILVQSLLCGTISDGLTVSFISHTYTLVTLSFVVPTITWGLPGVMADRGTKYTSTILPSSSSNLAYKATYSPFGPSSVKISCEFSFCRKSKLQSNI